MQPPSNDKRVLKVIMHRFCLTSNPQAPMLLHGGNTLIIGVCDILLEGREGLRMGWWKVGRREGERDWGRVPGRGGVLHAVSVSAIYMPCSQVV